MKALLAVFAVFAIGCTTNEDPEPFDPDEFLAGACEYIMLEYAMGRMDVTQAVYLGILEGAGCNDL